MFQNNLSNSNTLVNIMRESIANELWWLCAEKGDNVDKCKQIYDSYNIDLIIPNINNRTCIHIACYKGNLQIAKWLYSLKPADIYVMDKSNTNAIYSSIREGQLEILKWMIETLSIYDFSEPDIYDQYPIWFLTNFDFIDFNKRLDILKYLILYNVKTSKSINNSIIDDIFNYLSLPICHSVSSGEKNNMLKYIIDWCIDEISKYNKYRESFDKICLIIPYCTNNNSVNKSLAIELIYATIKDYSMYLSDDKINNLIKFKLKLESVYY